MDQITIPVIQKHYLSDRLWRERRHPQWTQNYELYRDTVIINRLTQRQSVNVPYMKKTLKTYLTQTNWPVDNYYEDKGNDKQKEIYLNAYWDELVERCRLDILEEVDRKQEWLNGRSFMKLNVVDGYITMEVIDPMDILLDRFMNPWDVESARRITHIGIFRTLSDIKLNPFYDQTAVKALEDFFATKQGLIRAGQNAVIAADKAQKMQDMGVQDVLNPVLGETYVELNELQVKVWDEAKQEDVVMVVVTANGDQILMQKPMREILGINRFTICTWAGDVERTDVWSDGGADSVRQMNLVANARWSQKVENGTLANYGMTFYDSTLLENWTPVGYDPAPFGFYPFPGDPNKGMRPVQINEMENVTAELDWIDKEIQGVSGATAIEQGEEEDGSGAQTAQEIQILASKAKERAQNVSKYHKRYWMDIGRLFVEIVMANKDLLQPVKRHKKGRSGKYYAKELHPAQMYSEQGYEVKVGSKADKESDSLDMVKKMQVAQQLFPNNGALTKIFQKKVVDWLGLTPDEQQEVEEAAMAPMPGAPPGAPPGSQPVALPSAA